MVNYRAKRIFDVLDTLLQTPGKVIMTPAKSIKFNDGDFHVMSVFPTKSVVFSGQTHTDVAFFSNNDKLFLSNALYGFRDISMYTTVLSSPSRMKNPLFVHH